MNQFEFSQALLFLEDQIRDLRDGLKDMTPDELAACRSQLAWFRSIGVTAVGVWAVADEKAARKVS